MKKTLLLIISWCCYMVPAQSQCTITDATSCVCADGTTDCDLLPDITISWYALGTYQSGPTEYSQTGNGANDGKLRLTGSTPNIGYGAFTVHAQDDNNNKLIVCGTDTFTVPATTTFTCPNGELPKQILRQRIYHKNGNTMTYREHLTPPMTYSNSSMYVDEWGIFSLRLQIPSDPNPFNWPIIGTGKKRAFCLMDYGSCTSYNGHCRDDNTVYQGGTALLNGNFPNWGLGNNYSCSATEQGISSGYTDIYSEGLDGMWITIPPNTCNGDYWILYEVDPHNYFEESDETNNYTLVPFTLTQQSVPGNPVATISSDKSPLVCGNDSVVLTASAGWDYQWSNGANTQSIKVGPGVYSVAVTNYCGIAVSPQFTVTSLPTPANPVTIGDTICVGDPAQLFASGANISWYDVNGVLAGTGNTFTTPPLLTTATYYAQDHNNVPGITSYGAKSDSTGGGGYYTGSQYLLFTTLKPIILKSVKVYANTAGIRTIDIQNSTGQLLQTGTFNLPVGESRVYLNYNIPLGIDLRITVSGTPNLWRDNIGVSYPYTITDTLSVTGSSAGTDYYYFFYDWEVETGQSSCGSLKVPAEATVESCTGVNYASMNQLINVYPNPTSGIFNVSLVATHTDPMATMTVLDISGRTLLTENMQLIEGKKYQKQIDISKYSSCILFVKMTINNRDYYRKLVIL